MKWSILLTTIVIGCGGSGRGATDPAAQAREAERKRIEAMRPERPYETLAVRGYRAPDTCGQGPYRVETVAQGAHFGERLEVNICAPRSLQGDYRLRKGPYTDEPRHFGSRNNSEHCLATTAEAAHRAAPIGPTSSNPVNAGATSTASSGYASADPASSPTSTPPSAVAVALSPMSESVGAWSDRCPDGMYLTGIVDTGTEMETGDGVPWKAGMPIVLELWSAEPLHLDGAIFVVIQRGVRAGMTLEEWTSYRAADERWREIWNAYLSGEVTAGRAEYADMTARTDAPPLPRIESKPPRPSTHAEWITGYWQRAGEWIWSPGFWRVPESDIVAEQTIEAPIAPPPAKAEPPPAPPAPPAPTPTPAVATATPAATARMNWVWTPGYWTWNGSIYVWVEGAWRIPPQGDARWVAPTWKPRRGRVVLSPGGWSVRIGR